MPIILPHGLTTPEFRVLQEFRRLAADTLSLETIKAIKHPAGALGETPAVSLMGKGFLTGEDAAFTLTQKSKDILAFDPVPMFEGGGDTTASVEADV